MKKIIIITLIYRISYKKKEFIITNLGCIKYEEFKGVNLQPRLSAGL
jgi:hypothetical protein